MVSDGLHHVHKFFQIPVAVLAKPSYMICDRLNPCPKLSAVFSLGDGGELFGDGLDQMPHIKLVVDIMILLPLQFPYSRVPVGGHGNNLDTTL